MSAEVTVNLTGAKITRLPWEIRNQLCERMLDGQQGPEILAWLNALPEFRALGLAPVNPPNLTAWKLGGYRRWLEERDKTQRLAKLAEQAGHIAAATGDPAGVSSRLLLGRILETLETADESDLAKLVEAVAALRKGEIAAAKVAADRKRLVIAEDNLRLSQEKFDAEKARADEAQKRQTAAEKKAAALEALCAELKEALKAAGKSSAVDPAAVMEEVDKILGRKKS